MIPLWKWKNPIYFGVITIIPFDNLYRREYFVMHTFLVWILIGRVAFCVRPTIEFNTATFLCSFQPMSWISNVIH